MNELEICRREITEIDAEMARLFEARMGVAARIAEYKKVHGISIKDEEREEALINKNRSLIKGHEVEEYYVRFIRNIIDLSCDYQNRLTSGMRVSYSGTAGAFAHIAAKRMFPTAELVAYPDFESAFHAAEKGECDCAVLPLENSYAGEVGAVMDLIFSGGMFVNQVSDVYVAHNLMACKGTELSKIKKVVSHSQALSQCSAYLQKLGVEVVNYSNTALAAKYVKELNDPTVAAIASDETAETFGLEILERDISDSKNNTTRFAAFSRAQGRPAAGSVKREDENFILVFTMQNEAGSLAKALNIIGSHGFNMRSLRSRPMKNLQWNYFFYIEAEGNIHTEDGNDMLRELSAVCAKLKLAGSYFADNVK